MLVLWIVAGATGFMLLGAVMGRNHDVKAAAERDHRWHQVMHVRVEEFRSRLPKVHL